MKFKSLLLLLLLFISFTACVERIERIQTKEHLVNIPPEFSVEKETLKSRISAIIPAEKISFNSSKTTKTGEADYHTLNVNIELISFPSNGIAFYRVTDEIRAALESGISNMSDYQKMTISVRQTTVENDVEHTRTYKKEIDL